MAKKDIDWSSVGAALAACAVAGMLLFGLVRWEDGRDAERKAAREG